MFEIFYYASHHVLHVVIDISKSCPTVVLYSLWEAAKILARVFHVQHDSLDSVPCEITLLDLVYNYSE